MAKWQKYLAIFAAGSIVTGVLSIVAGAIVGGVSDVKRIYMAPEPEPTVITTEYDNISKLNLVLTGTAAVVEVADVKKVTLIETKHKFVENHSGYPVESIPGKVNTSIKDGSLHVENEPNIPIENLPSVETDILSFFRIFRKPNLNYSLPITIQIPKDMALEEVTVQLKPDATLTFSQFKAKQLQFTNEMGTHIGLHDVVIDQIEGKASSAVSLEIYNSYIKAGNLTIDSGNYHTIQESRLENLNVTTTDVHLDFVENQIKDSSMVFDGKLHDGSGSDDINFDGIDFLGEVKIDTKGSHINLFETPNIEDVTLDLTADKGNITLDVESLPRTFIDDEVQSTYQRQGKNEKAKVTITSSEGGISIIDASSRDGYTPDPDWQSDGSPDFKRFDQE